MSRAALRGSAPPIVHWFTSDLRLTDNPALAAGRRGEIAAVFVLDPECLARAAAAPRRVAFMMACLAELDRALAARGSRLLVCEGAAEDELPRVAAALGARLLTHARNYEPAAMRRETRVVRALGGIGIDTEGHDASSVHPPGEIRSRAGSAYVMYGAFARAWSAHPIAPRVTTPRRWVPGAALACLGRCGLDAPRATASPLAGEPAARRRLSEFIRHHLRGYAAARDLPGAGGTSRLSPHLRFGTISAADAARQVRAAAGAGREMRESATTWLRELAWRDFFAQLLQAFPHAARRSFRPLRIRWRIDDDGFRRWQDGRTGYPLVDAGMRELSATGFMHNRARMVTASFLTRHLLLDWRLGEAHFMAHLLDGQLSQNNGNWQWVAGTGADAQPFHRIFSPVRQGQRFDREGSYVKRWVPELLRVPTGHVHEPWTLTRGDRRALCPDYPPPVVGHEEARARALAALGRARAGPRPRVGAAIPTGTRCSGKTPGLPHSDND
jgi:deoxyribodipyrimidine photo-lyase